MENFKLPAYPLPMIQGPSEVWDAKDFNNDNGGFTKLELAALMIAQGLVNWKEGANSSNREFIASESVRIAKIVLEEANK
jgi:hypothetical protein